MPDIISLPVDGTKTKEQIVRQAYGLLAIRFDSLDADLMADGLAALNLLMLDAPWNQLGYNQPTFNEGNLAEFSGLIDAYVPAVLHELARSLASTMGKALPAETKARLTKARRSLDALLATVPELKIRNGVHLGAGWRPYRESNQLDRWSYTAASE
jgi:hypothetical protein